MEIKKVLVDNEYVDFCTSIDLEEIEENDFNTLDENTIDLSNVIENVSKVNNGGNLNGWY